MNPEIKEKWIAALRSGKYAQTTGTLHNKDGYCCLGVLCDLAVKENIVPDWEYEDDILGIREADYIQTSVLPLVVRAWAEISGYNGGVEFSEGKTLTEVNDFDKLNFDQIANLIEEYL